MIADVQTKLAPCGSLSQLKQPARCTALRSLRCKETTELRHRPSAWRDARIVLSAHCFLALSRLWICDPQGTPGYTSTLCTVPWEQSKVGWPFSRLQGRKSSTPLAKASSWFAISCYWIMRSMEIMGEFANHPIPSHSAWLQISGLCCTASSSAALHAWWYFSSAPSKPSTMASWMNGLLDVPTTKKQSEDYIIYHDYIIYILLYIYIILYI